jgi:cytochrome c biogenesis protein CcmG, thiol:disulfide interchange protein DsbE
MPKLSLRYFIPAVAFLVLGGLFAVVLVRIGDGKLDIREIKSPLLGKRSPAFRLPSLEDATVSIDSHAYEGRVYLLNVWGSWCSGCRDEHAALRAIARSSGVPIVGLDWKDDPVEARAFLQKLGNPYDAVASDLEGRVAIDWGVYGAPESFLVAADGTVLEKHVGPLTEAIWAEKFAPLVKSAAP